MRKTIILIGTYNERDNIGALITRILDLNKGLHVLVVDDNSPDGTGQIVDGLAAKHRDISVIHRPGKAGLGTAYVAGFHRALGADYDTIITMDADFSHDPKYLPLFLDEMERYDVVIGTRYTAGGGVENWPFWRQCLSRCGSIYTQAVTGMPCHDATGGYNAYHREVLEAIQPETIRSEGYSFQIEMKYRSWKKGFRISELPIVFVDRTLGKSKMNKKIFIEALFMVWRLRFTTC